MKIRNLTTMLLYIVFVFLFNNADAQQTFNNAEEKIVYNKQNGLPKYEGIRIEYSYKFLTFEQVSESNLAKIKQFFPNALDFRVEKVGEEFLIYILTEGDRKNHDRYNEALAHLPEVIAKGKRRYLLI